MHVCMDLIELASKSLSFFLNCPLELKRDHELVSKTIIVMDQYWKGKTSNKSPRTVLSLHTYTEHALLKLGPEWGLLCVCMCVYVCVARADKSCLDVSSGCHNTLREKVSQRRISGRTVTALLCDSSLLSVASPFHTSVLFLGPCSTGIIPLTYSIFHPIHIQGWVIPQVKGGLS